MPEDRHLGSQQHAGDLLVSRVEGGPPIWREGGRGHLGQGLHAWVTAGDVLYLLPGEGPGCRCPIASSPGLTSL